MINALRRLAPAVLLFCSGAAFAAEKTIYGEDDRREYYEAAPEWRKLADSTVALFDSDRVSFYGVLSLNGYGEFENLCRTERFYDQPKGPFCSGALVAPDLVLTAGHCVMDAAACAHTKLVFGYAFKYRGVTPSRVMPWDVYGCAAIKARVYSHEGVDYALLRLNRPVYGRAPLRLDRGAGAAAGDKVVSIGYPRGLPLKVIGGAAVRDASDRDVFVTDLDAFGGNSGAPVFNAETRLVEGIFVRGDRDFVRKGDCMVANVNPQDGGRGEDVIRISLAAPLVPESGAGPSSAVDEAAFMAVPDFEPEAGLGERAAALEAALAGG